MCFSTEASFIGGAVIIAIGVATVRKVHKPSQLVFACIPLFFGITILGFTIFNDLFIIWSIINSISITSLDLSDKCSVCGLPVAIMQRNTCFDPKCGIK